MAFTVWARQHLTVEPAYDNDAKKWAEDWAKAWEAKGWNIHEWSDRGACLDVTVGTMIECGEGAHYPWQS